MASLHFSDLNSSMASPKRTSLGSSMTMKMSHRMKSVPSLDGGRSPFGDLPRERRDNLKLPPLPGKVPLAALDGDPLPSVVSRSAPASRQSDVPTSPLHLSPAPTSAPPGKRERKHRRRPVPVDDGGTSCKNLRPPTEGSTRCGSAASAASYLSRGLDSPTSFGLPVATTDVLINGEFGWVRGNPIGSGTHACVFKALEKQTGRVFAVKKSVVDQGDESDRKYRERLEDELRICKDLRHPNIVACLGFECTEDSFYIYLEYVPGGSMASLLSEFGALDPKLLKQATSGLLEGLNYLHTRNPPVVHRDIKGANILVDLNFCVKLADFGCSKRSDLTRSFTTIGSIPWMAPEVILQSDGYGRKADLWSLGCAVLEMATAEKPWGNGKFENVMYALRHISMTDATPPIPESMEEAGKDFIRLCTQRDPAARPSAAKLMSHAWLDSSTAV